MASLVLATPNVAHGKGGGHGIGPLRPLLATAGPFPPFIGAFLRWPGPTGVGRQAALSSRPAALPYGWISSNIGEAVA
jgi:hypothetical protein